MIDQVVFKKKIRWYMYSIVLQKNDTFTQHLTNTRPIFRMLGPHNTSQANVKQIIFLMMRMS